MNTFLELALHRRSIRKYQDRPIEREKIEQILQAALSSPSSKHLNPWEFVVVEDRQILSSLADCKTYGSVMLKQSPLGIVVCCKAQETDTWQCDGSIAALNMLLAAEDLGLGACWVHIYERENAENLVRQALNIPDELSVLCLLSIGYKAEDKHPINPDKLQYDKIHYGKY